MLVGIALVLLLAWLLGILGLYDAGELVHGFLLVGLTLLVAVLKRAVDAAGRPDGDPPRP